MCECVLVLRPEAMLLGAGELLEEFRAAGETNEELEKFVKAAK